MRRKCKIVMLSTEKANQRLFFHCPMGSNIKILSSDQGKLHHEEMMKCGVSRPQHLYILSDEEIKEGDWYIHINTNTLLQRSQHKGEAMLISNKKIIATTNPELNHKESYTKGKGNSKDYFNKIITSEISQDFIEVYIKEYNAGNPIKEVMVEYKEGCCIGGIHFAYCVEECKKPISTLKLRPDNTIFISRIKEKMYSRDEILKSFDKLYKDFGMMSNEFYKNWITKNYPE